MPPARSVDMATTPGAIAVFGCFAPEGPQHRSGLPVARYNPARPTRQIGSKWLLIWPVAWLAWWV